MNQLRRGFKLVIGACCVLSLLVCIGTAWLGWRKQRVFWDEAFIGTRTLGVNIMSVVGESDEGWGGTFSICFVRGWPDNRFFSVASFAIEDDVQVERVRDSGIFPGTRNTFDWRRVGVHCFCYPEQVYTTPDGSRPLLTNDPQPEFSASSIDSREPPNVKVTRVRILASHTKVVSATSVLPLIWIVLWSRRVVSNRRRRRQGLCRRCGYDLTGNVSGRCSECGEPTSAAASVL